MGTFDPSKLKVGDEVGVTWQSWGGRAESIRRVTAIQDDGCIVVEGEDLPFWPDDGREVELVIGGVVTPSPNGTRLCVPSDAGRAQMLRWSLGEDLESLEERLHDLALGDLKEVDATIKALLAKHPPRAAIDVPVVEEYEPTMKLVRGE